MITIRRVSAASLDDVEKKPKALSPAQLKRQAMERSLARAIRGADQDGARVAYRIVLDKDDKASTVKSAFRRVKEAEGASDVNLLTVGDALYVAKRAQRRGRRPGTSSR